MRSFVFVSFAEIFAIHPWNVCVQLLFTVDKLEREPYEIGNTFLYAAIESSSKIDSIQLAQKQIGFQYSLSHSNWSFRFLNRLLLEMCFAC